MANKAERLPKGVDWLAVISVGFFLFLIGVVWIVNYPKVADEAAAFVMPDNWHSVLVAGSLYLPEPTQAYPTLFAAFIELSVVFGFFLIGVLVVRFLDHHSVGRKADTVSWIAFWFAEGFFMSLVARGSIAWFGFLAGFVVSVGLAVVASSIVKLFER